MYDSKVVAMKAATTHAITPMKDVGSGGVVVAVVVMEMLLLVVAVLL